MSLDKKVMIYSPDLDGHRQIYCANLIDYFFQKGCKVYLMTAGFAGKSWEKVTNNPYLYEYLKSQNVKLVRIFNGNYQENQTNQIKLVADLQARYNIDYTIFAFADTLTNEMTTLASPFGKKLIGKNYGIFLTSSNYIYQGLYCYSEKGLFGQILGGLRWHMIYRKFNLKAVLFLNVLLKYFRVLDGCFFLDENFLKKNSCKKFHHLPDPSRPFRNMKGVGNEEELHNIKQNYSAFLKLNINKDVILCFGKEQDRHGVDYLLRLVEQCPDLVYVHLGKTNGEILNKTKHAYLKNRLNQQYRIFEIDRWIADQRIIDLFFDSIKYLLLPYKNHYGSSGMMLEALSYGKPVLVPDIGLMNVRVINHQLGRTFKRLSYDSFYEQFNKLRTEYRIYADTTNQYFQNNFSRHRIIQALEKMGI